jgi:cytochrome c oxidase subunit 2
VRERTVLALVLISFVLVALGFLAANQLDLLPDLAASRAAKVESLFRIMLGIAAVIFFIVEGALVFAIIRFRKRPGDELDGKPYHGNNTLEAIWTVIPAIIVIAIGFMSYDVLSEIERTDPDELIVEVVGRQFTWEFHYPAYDVSSSELHLPVNQPARLEISSDDVIHSFWVPNFLAKRDATPGRIAELALTPTELGQYPVRCAELCGAGHAIMTSVVIVQTRAEFQAWLDSEVQSDEG